MMTRLNSSLRSHAMPLLLLWLAAVNFAGCASISTPPSFHAKEVPAMTAPTIPSLTPELSVAPELRAEQLLRRLLDLIRNSKSIREFTPEYLSRTMGVDFVTYEPGYHAFGEELTSKWGYGMEMRNDITTARIKQFDFSFNSGPGMPPSMSSLCEFDFDQFTAELEAMGFTRSSSYDSPPQPPPGQPALPHGSWLYDYFDRPGMRVKVIPQWILVPTLKKGGRHCVKTVLIS